MKKEKLNVDQLVKDLKEKKFKSNVLNLTDQDLNDKQVASIIEAMCENRLPHTEEQLKEATEENRLTPEMRKGREIKGIESLILDGNTVGCSSAIKLIMMLGANHKTLLYLSLKNTGIGTDELNMIIKPIQQCPNLVVNIDEKFINDKKLSSIKWKLACNQSEDWQPPLEKETETKPKQSPEKVESSTYNTHQPTKLSCFARFLLCCCCCSSSKKYSALEEEYTESDIEKLDLI